MRIRFVIVALVASLIACSHPATQSAVPVSSTSRVNGTSFSTHAATHIPALVLSSANDIYLYDSSGRQVGAIPTSEGQGAVAFDKQGDIYYSPYQQYNYHILIFSPPYSGTPKEILFKGLGYAIGVAVDWNTGIFAVMTDAYAPYPHYHSAVWFFRHGDVKPCAGVMEPSSWSWAPTSSFDASGVLFTSKATGPGFTVVSVAGECGAKTLVKYQPFILNIYTLQFNTKNELVVHESTGYKSGPLLTFPHPQNGQLATPVSKTRLDDINGKPAGLMTLTSDGAHLWASAFYGEAAQYHYPAGGRPNDLINVQYVGGGAVYPPPVP